MAKTYRITIEYTTTDDEAIVGPESWNWYDLLDINPSKEAWTVDVEQIDTDQDHVRYIKEENEFA
jgi:hypothetical protein